LSIRTRRKRKRSGSTFLLSWREDIQWCLWSRWTA
jgi:hypothetical protein